MAKAILFDADGVVIKEHEYFSVRYKRDFGKSLNDDIILNFFKNEYKDTAVGQADLKELLAERIEEWGWDGSVDELLTYWFEGEREVDSDVLTIVKTLRDTGVICCLASDNEAYRAEYLLDVVGLREHFDEVFFSCYVGHTKSELEFFLAIIDRLNVSLDEILYFDDDPKNVEVAKGVGIHGVHYTAVAQLERLV